MAASVGILRWHRAMSHERQPLLAGAPEENNTDAGRACVQVTKIGEKKVCKGKVIHRWQSIFRRASVGVEKEEAGRVSKDQTIFTTSLLFKVQNENEVSVWGLLD